MPLLPEPKRKRMQQGILATSKREREARAEEGCQSDTPRGVNLTPKHRIDNRGKEKEESLRPVAADVVASAIEEGKAKTRAALIKHAGKSGTDATEKSLWKLTFMDFFPGTMVTPWTPKERGQCGHLKRELGDRFEAVVRWSIENWHMIRASKFPKARGIDFPAFPEFGFLYAFRKTFIGAWNEREQLVQMAGNGKAGLIRYFQNQGYTYEQAVAEAGASEKLSARERKVREREAALKTKEAILTHYRPQLTPVVPGVKTAQDVADHLSSPRKPAGPIKREEDLPPLETDIPVWE